jgi:hypothetical protein
MSSIWRQISMSAPFPGEQLDLEGHKAHNNSKAAPTYIRDYQKQEVDRQLLRKVHIGWGTRNQANRRRYLLEGPHADVQSRINQQQHLLKKHEQTPKDDSALWKPKQRPSVEKCLL